MDLAIRDFLATIKPLLIVYLFLKPLKHFYNTSCIADNKNKFIFLAEKRIDWNKFKVNRAIG